MTNKETVLGYVWRVLDRALALRVLVEHVVGSQPHPLLKEFDNALDDLWKLSPDEVKEEMAWNVFELAQDEAMPWTADLYERIEVLMNMCARQRVRSFVEDTLMPLLNSSSLADLAGKLGVQPRTIKYYYRFGYVKADAAREILNGIKKHYQGQL